MKHTLYAPRMTEWEVWRQDDDGHRYLMISYHDRIHALARLLVLESGHPHKQMYEVMGPTRPVVITNRELYLRLVALGDYLAGTERALLDYLCALWTVTRPLAIHDELDGDHFAAVLLAAATAVPARPDPSWRVDDYTSDGPYLGFADFTKVVCTQVADLLAFEEKPPGPFASFGVDAPTRLDGGRATIPRWCNFDPATFLECAAAGAFGGWSESDGRRVRTAETGDGADWSGETVTPLEPITWGDFAAFLEYGQSYE
jgi:hypothetical protein